MMILLQDIYSKPNVVPSRDKVFRAFEYFKPKDTKVIILGQDPYPNKKDACGLAFAVEHSNIPPSLKNVFKKLQHEYNHTPPRTGNLEPWAKQGVLLANTILTATHGKKLSHENLGWQDFVARRIQNILNYHNPLVIIAWGKHAQRFVENRLEVNGPVRVIYGGHPSPYSADSFFERDYFAPANEHLKEHGIEPIDWRL